MGRVRVVRAGLSVRVFLESGNRNSGREVEMFIFLSFRFVSSRVVLGLTKIR